MFDSIVYWIFTIVFIIVVFFAIQGIDLFTNLYSGKRAGYFIEDDAREFLDSAIHYISRRHFLNKHPEYFSGRREPIKIRARFRPEFVRNVFEFAWKDIEKNGDESHFLKCANKWLDHEIKVYEQRQSLSQRKPKSDI